MRFERIEFPNSKGEKLAARLDLPDERPRAHALFAHCFTCSKDIFAASRISAALAGMGIATLRFDFTGLGSSEGEFANTNFSSNVQDLLSAVDYLRGAGRAPLLLIGHSLGGAAVLKAAVEVPEAAAVVTIAAPANPAHVVEHFGVSVPEIERTGVATVTLAGRTFRIQKQFLDDIAGHSLERAIGSMGKALLVMHAPRDDTVGIENATRIFVAAKHPKSFVSLDDADHLLSRRDDAVYAANTIAAWASRYLPDAPAEPAPTLSAGEVVVVDAGRGYVSAPCVRWPASPARR